MYSKVSYRQQIWANTVIDPQSVARNVDWEHVDTSVDARQ